MNDFFAARRPRLLLAALLVATPWTACATPAVHKRFQPLSAAEAASILPLPAQAASHITRYVADGRMTHFAAGRRARAQLRLLVERPDRWRYTVLSPQGPPLFVLASDGQQLTSLEVGSSQFRALPATTEGLAQLAPALGFSLPPQDLVRLLFGEVAVPPDAQVAAQADQVRFSWPAKQLCWQADFGRQDGRLLRLQGSRAQTTPATPVLVAEVLRWSPQGLPAALRLTAPNSEDAGGEQILEVDVGHFDLAPQVSSQAFAVRP